MRKRATQGDDMDQKVLAVEKALATAHRAIYGALGPASGMRDLGLHDDLQMIQLELERLQVDLLRGSSRRRASLINRAYL